MYRRSSSSRFNYSTPVSTSRRPPSLRQHHGDTPFPSVLKPVAEQRGNAEQENDADVVMHDVSLKTPFPATNKRQGTQSRRRFGRDITNTAQRNASSKARGGRGRGKSYFQSAIKTPMQSRFTTPVAQKSGTGFKPRFVFDSVQKQRPATALRIRQDSPQMPLQQQQKKKKEQKEEEKHKHCQEQKSNEEAKRALAWDEEPPELCPEDKWQPPQVDEDTKELLDRAWQAVGSYKKKVFLNSLLMSDPIVGIDDWEPEACVEGYEPLEELKLDTDLYMNVDEERGFDMAYFEEFIALGMPIRDPPVLDVPQLSVAVDETGELVVF